MKTACAVALAACLVGTAMAVPNPPQQTNQQNPNVWNRHKENAQEKASGINDKVDIVNGPTVENLTANSASLTWTTDDTSATRVRYGTDQQNPAQHAYVAGGTKDHRVELSNLKPNTTYHYEIETRGGKDRFKGSFHTPGQ